LLIGSAEGGRTVTAAGIRPDHRDLRLCRIQRALGVPLVTSTTLPTRAFEATCASRRHGGGEPGRAVV